jgi:hypothetical protein
VLAGPDGADGALHFMPTNCARAVICSARSTRPVSTADSRCPSDSDTWCPSSLGFGSETDVVVAVVLGAVVAAKGGFAAKGVSVAGHWGVGCRGRQELRLPARELCGRRVLGLCRALATRQVLGLQGDLDTGARQSGMAWCSQDAVESLSWRRYCSQALEVKGGGAVLVVG